MKDWTAMFASLRAGILGPKLEQNEVEGVNVLCRAMLDDNWPIAWAAYGLATAYHETAGTLKPIKEYGGPKYFNRRYGPEGDNPSRARQFGNTAPGDGARYAGRGYVQLTWKVNYAKASKALGVDLVGNPDLAMTDTIAAKIMVRGMREGWFTGLDCADCLPGQGPGVRSQFVRARRIINGTDKADMIAGYALAFQAALKAGGWE